MKVPSWLAWALPPPPLAKLLTPRAKQALALARRVAFERADSGSVDTEHLLASLLRLNQGSITHVIWTAGIDVAALRARLERADAVPATPEEAMRMPFRPSIKRSLSAARREARSLHDAHVGVEHLLLGMLACGEGQAGRMLAERGLTLEHARRIIRTLRAEQADPPSSQILVMFDVDGTLTESFDLDSATYLDALREVFGFLDVSDDWAVYKNVTDAGILAEIFETRLGRLPTLEEVDRLRTRFTALLTARIEAAGGIRPMAGAGALLAHLRGSPEKFAVAYASGGWKIPACLKLRSAGLPVDDVPGAFSDDDVSREGICQAAHRRAEERGGLALPRVVYVGDGVWDVRTSLRVGYGFVGIGREARADELKSAGAVEVRPDFQDATEFLAAVNRAAATASPDSPRSGETTAPAR